jgi:hypothetical protein
MGAAREAFQHLPCLVKIRRFAERLRAKKNQGVCCYHKRRSDETLGYIVALDARVRNDQLLGREAIFHLRRMTDHDVEIQPQRRK